tara:strand:+ start:312 stop:1157 length:846 start_codon:yes stop_codon:yes gene_type:complete
MNTISRQNLIAEELIRSHVRKRIEENLKQKNLAESKIRHIVRKIISETEAGTEEPSQYTGINVLASLLEKIIPIVEDDYKMLTTSEEQRESFRNHIVHAIKNSLRPIEAATQAENIPENFEFMIDQDALLEKITLDLDPQADGKEEQSIEGEFIDINQGDDVDSQFVQIQDQNETGRNFAATTFKQIEKQIVDAYDMLADEEDQNLFYDYLLTNMLLYFDKFEDELQANLPDATTPEYEKEKEKESSEEQEAASSAEETTETGEETETEEPAATDDPFADL